MPVIKPQPGPQEMFLASSADIAIFGGAAGGGKSFALLIEPMRHVTTNPGYNPVFFRRTTTQIRNPGGLWDESFQMYSPAGAEPLQQPLEWKFPKGGKVKFAHLEHESSVLDWQGSQIVLLAFDELCHFTKTQFFYMLSRNRSTCGVRPYVRATCNPDADSWVAEFIAWWINQDTGLPITERSGKLRWFVRAGDTIVWANRPSELANHTMVDDTGTTIPIPPKSVTFIPSKLTDNKALMKADPGYMANLMALPWVERERLLGGNWKVRPAAGLYFKRQWVTMLDAPPTDIVADWRGWDWAATPKTETNDPDWTTGTRIARRANGRFVVLHHVYDRLSPDGVERLVKNTASQDGKRVTISIAQDPGQSGKGQVSQYAKALAGYTVRFSPESRAAQSSADTPSKMSAKVVRFGPFSAQCEAGNVDVVAGSWNDRWFSALEAFPEAAHDDDADSTARAFQGVAGRVPMQISKEAINQLRRVA
jgi:predicted phage terminase large subunit-like protein